MTKAGKAGEGGVDWSGAFAVAESEPLVFEGRACHLGKLEPGLDPEVELANWKKARGERKAAEQVRSETLALSVQQALIASKQEVREVISEGRRRRSGGRIKDRNAAMLNAASYGSDLTMAEFWRSQNLRDDADHARRMASSPDEPKDRDREK